LEPDLDRYPLGLDLVSWDNYIFRDANHGTVTTSVSLSRGCPFGCSFCTNARDPDRRRWRRHSPAYARELAAFLKKNYGVNTVIVQDDNPFGNPASGREVIEAMGLNWLSAAHLHYATPEFLDWARMNGCLNLSFGLESGSNAVLQRMNKRIDRDTIRERMTLVGEKGLRSWAMWMAFVPGETEEDRGQTFALMEDLHRLNPLVQQHLSIYQAYPGTPFYEESLGLGLTEPKTLEQWTEYTGMIHHLMGFSKTRVERMVRDLRGLYYFDRDHQKTSPRLRRLLRRRLEAGTFYGPLEELLHYARLVRDAGRALGRRNK
jgi:radical SAM superfamily enzyme YgiQ (UPF0313 family)